ncbi:hypothetical protein [Paraflavitalea pollutisoli]|uniref:hypothetical protein n=1 Tax=Paraflavitalea pollutisoli TaxID=3034143 RepID=UPI0023EC4D59|nr:hypothetical protein [Paraflavitalea sp. H1-2-19X]
MKNDKKTIGAYELMMQKHSDRKDFVTLERSWGDNLTGFILGISKDFLLLQIDRDFASDGYAVIPKHGFESLRCNRFDRMSKKIYKGEGGLGASWGLQQPVSLDSWPDLFRSLRALDYHVIVELEDQEEPDFVIGPIKKVLKTLVGVQYYNPEGKLDARTTSIPYSEITIVRFGDRYSTVFRKYLK